MFIADIPNTPAQEPPLIVAEATASQKTAQKYDRVIGICHLSANPYNPKSAANTMSVADEAVWYLNEIENFRSSDSVKVTVLQLTIHGLLKDIGNGNYAYYPKKGFIGSDIASLLVEVGGKKIKLDYFFRVMQSIPIEAEGEPSVYEQGYCPKKARVWKISSSKTAIGNNIVTSSK